MRKIINEFTYSAFFLSNFYKCDLFYAGMNYSNSEAAFQGQKPKNMSERAKFQYLDPSESKAAGRMCVLRNDWDKVKDQIMYEVVTAKFTQNSDLKKKLIETGDSILIEGTTWGDTYWGIDLATGKGLNHLGKILEKVREDIGGWKRDYEEEDWLKGVTKN